jgi:ATP-dependent Lhr-like helicase
LLLAATDPAQPYGATLAWPVTEGRPARAAGALVVLSEGTPLAWFDRRSHHLLLFPAADSNGAWADAFASLIKDGRARVVEVRKLNGSAVPAASAAISELKRVGFVEGYRGLSLRP